MSSGSDGALPACHDAKRRNFLVDRYQCHVFQNRLSRKNSIERIAVFARQHGASNHMSAVDGKFEKAFLFNYTRKSGSMSDAPGKRPRANFVAISHAEAALT